MAGSFLLLSSFLYFLVLMPAITFQCGNCKNLMAVEDHLLGQQVRCPHCQQVVVVPESTPSTPPSSEPTPATVSGPAAFSSFPVDFPAGSPGIAPHHEEDIFTPPTHASDDLFGGVGLQPAVVIPPEPPAEHKQGDEAGPAERFEVQPAQTITTTHPSAPDIPSMAQTEGTPPPPDGTEPFASPSNAWPEATPSTATDLPVETPGDVLTRQVARRAKSESLFTTYLIIFLIPYAIFVTGVAAYFYLRMLDMQQRAPHPLEYLRDTGENPPAKRGSSMIESVSPDTNLPSRLQVALGQSLTIGDLQIQPLKVERRRLTICSENRQVRPQETAQDALVLTLRLHNLSDDVLFTPTDPVFDRQWKEEYGSSRPYTLLEMNGKKFFGGPIAWRPRSNRGAFRADDPREYVKGQESDNQALKPGADRTCIFCTDPGNREILQTLQGSKGPLVWRLHLRRGLVDVGDREVSATAVIGVVFDKKDILAAR
jgi:hypothetical protein